MVSYHQAPLDRGEGGRGKEAGVEESDIMTEYVILYDTLYGREQEMSVETEVYNVMTGAGVWRHCCYGYNWHLGFLCVDHRVDE